MKTLTILIVEDDQTTSAILTHMLEPYADTIVTAKDGIEGCDLYKSYAPDIILSDINMPKMNGLEMIEKIRKIDQNVKIAIFTNFEKRETLIRSIELGVNQFFSKPFDAISFEKMMKNLCNEVLEKRAASDAIKRQENILQTMNQMAHNFLQESNWRETLEEELTNLKKATEVSSIFLYKNKIEKKELLAQQLFYLNDNQNAKTKEVLSYTKDHLMGWKNQLEKDELINGCKKDYDNAKKKLLDLFKINSLLILPIFVQGKWWGFLGIGDEEDQVLAESHVEILSTATSIIGAAISNTRNLKSLQMSSAVFDHTIDGVLVTDVDNNIVHVNDAFLEITGYSREAAIGRNPRVLKSGKHDKHFYKKMWSQLAEEGYWQGEITNRKKNGEIYIEWLSINTIKNTKGEIENYIGIFSDVTHQRKDEQDNAYLATHDPLTKLSNRLLLNDRLEHAINHASRFGKCISLIFCDLDNFKPINDTYGHNVGDEILKHVAAYLKKSLRKEDTICRFGGDEFVILIEELDNFEFLNNILRKINDITNTPCIIDGNTIHIGMSIGASIFPDDGIDAQELIKSADEAMYKAKEQGKNCIEFSKFDINQYCLRQIEAPNNYSI
ncbi:MAG TPA: diguanylate cyclase [Epsilonproteobacteria bacterium]|nr:diguanylate cyclase [Campylobacterota bacterium]